MEYELESLINDWQLPREVIQADIDCGRLHIYQLFGNNGWWVEHDVLIEYLTTRVAELRPEQQLAVWSAIRRIMLTPGTADQMHPDEHRAVIQAIDRELARCREER